MPALARLEGKRQRTDALGEIVQVLRCPDLRFCVLLIYWIPDRVEAVGEAAGVGEQVQHGHGVLGRHQLALYQHVQVGQFRHELGNWVRELKLALFVEHHSRHAGDRLGHGEDAKEGILGERPVVVRTALPNRLEVDDLALPRHQRNRAGELLLIHIALRDGGDAIKDARRTCRPLVRLRPRDRRRSPSPSRPPSIARPLRPHSASSLALSPAAPRPQALTEHSAVVPAIRRTMRCNWV